MRVSFLDRGGGRFRVIDQLYRARSIDINSVSLARKTYVPNLTLLGEVVCLVEILLSAESAHLGVLRIPHREVRVQRLFERERSRPGICSCQFDFELIAKAHAANQAKVKRPP